jgi:anti-sigma-K factor RskA
MIPVKHIDPEDLPLYAMQLLSPEETDEITLHLQHSAEARRVLAEIQGDLAVFAYTAEMQTPPALARQRLMKHVARERKPVPIDIAPIGSYAPRESTLFEEEAPQRSAAARVLPWIGWAIAAGLGFATFTLFQQTEHLRGDLASQKNAMAKLTTSADVAKTVASILQDPTATRVTLVEQDAKPSPHGRAVYDSEKGSLASNLEPLKPYKTYELWLIPADGRDPIAAGTFKPDARGYANVILPALPKGVAAAAFGVTVEDDGGAVSPTLPIILTGKAV